MIVPEKLLSAYLRATRAKAPFVSVASARARIESRQLRPAPYGPPKRLRSDVRVTVDRILGNPVYTLTPEHHTPTGHIVYAHGGAWVNEISPQHWDLAAQIAAEAHATVTVPIYALLPYGTAQDAHELILTIAHRLRKTHPDVRLAGDSAGGQIALSAALTLRDQGITDVRTVLISPALDLTVSNPKIPSLEAIDPWIAPDGSRELGRFWAGGLPVDDPIVSPLNGEFNGLGPMMVLTGTHEILNPDAHLLVRQARHAGVDVTLLEHKGGVHVFPLLPSKAGQAARARIVTALRSGKTN